MDVKFISHNNLVALLSTTKKLVLDSGVYCTLCSAYCNKERTESRTIDRSLDEDTFDFFKFTDIFWNHANELELFTTNLCRRELDNTYEMSTERERKRLDQMISRTKVINAEELITTSEKSLKVKLSPALGPADESIAQIAYNLKYPMITCDKRCVRSLLAQLGYRPVSKTTIKKGITILQVWVFPSCGVNGIGEAPPNLHDIQTQRKKRTRETIKEINGIRNQKLSESCDHIHKYYWQNQYTRGVKCLFCRKNLELIPEEFDIKLAGYERGKQGIKCPHPAIRNEKCWLCNQQVKYIKKENEIY